MRLIEMKGSGELSLTKNFTEDIPRYAILSHTWGGDDDEVTFADFIADAGSDKIGYKKIEFCQKQAAKDGLQYFWIDTCCIDKSDPVELSEAINSMFQWYRDAVKCYVYLSDVSTRGPGAGESISRSVWGLEFRQSRWFTRAWTLQELIAPATVEFFSREGERLGDKGSEEASLEEITGFPVEVFRGKSLAEYSVDQWMIWATERTAKRKEDEAYCLLGIFNVHMSLQYGEGRAKAFARLHSKIYKQSQYKHSDPTTIVRGNVHWMVPRAMNDLFTGRVELVARMQQALRHEIKSGTSKQRRFVITGLGGQGKSEVCLQVANLVREEFWGVFWVDVGNPNTAERDFISIAETLGRTIQSVPDALKLLAATKHTWLLILDNADDPKLDYAQYLPSGNHGSVIITSRNPGCKRFSPDAFEALEGLENKQSKELLLKAAGISRDLWQGYNSEVSQIVQLLGLHTLALIQAGAYIAQGHCQLQEYPQKYQRQRERLLKYRSELAQSRSCNVFATFEASAEALLQSKSKAAEDALQLLQILSMLNSGFLPLRLFEETYNGCRRVVQSNVTEASSIDKLVLHHVSELPGFVVAEEAEWDSYRLVEGTSLLASLSLVTRHDLDGSPGISMHPLTHAWAKDRQNTKQQGAAWFSTGCILAFSRESDHLWRTQERRLLPHVQSYLSIKIKKAFTFASEATILPIILNCGQALSIMRQDSTLGRLLDNTFSELKLKLDQPSEGFLPLYVLQAISLSNLGKSEETVPLLEQVVKISEAIRAEDNPDRLASQHALAMAYQANGQVKEAVALHKKVVKIRETIQAEVHPDRLASQHALAKAYQANGQVKKAVALNEKVFKIMETIQAEDHPSRLGAQHALAVAYWANRQVKEAVALLETVVNIRETIQAEDHPDRLASQHALARAYQANGQVKEAVALHEKVVKIFETIHAENHFNRLAAQHALAIAYWADGQIKEAVALLELVVKLKRLRFHQEHPSRLVSEKALSDLLRHHKQF